ncbi:DUF927 domain-containing protein [archaeon]|nr:DUF927 domain-containing protein [archaeon]
MNPKTLCRFACSRYKIDCPYNATDLSEIFEHVSNGINCDELKSIKHNGIDVPHPFTFVNQNKEFGTFEHITKTDPKTETVEDIYQIICYQPTWLNNCFIDPLTKLHYVELCYMYRNDVITQIVSQKDVLTTTGLKGLTAAGLNVPESKTRTLSDYFATYISKSETLCERPIHSRFGWVFDDDSFVIGNKNISTNGTTEAYLTQDVALETIDALEPNGTIAGWVEATQGLLQYDNVRFVCYAVTTSLILKVLGGASFVVELVGDTSLGKTITAQLAMSIFGNPKKLKLATSATKVFIERTCTTCSDLPIFLDETSMMQSEVLTEISYMIANERSRGRGKKEGGVEKVSTWKTVLLTTGEVPLLSLRSLGGQDVRTVSIYGGVGAHDPENVEKYKDQMTKNCGQIAPLIIKKILENKHKLKEYYVNIRDTLKEYSELDSTGATGRVVDTYALISLSGFIFESVMEDLGVDPIDALSLVETKFSDKMTQSEGSISDRAYMVVSDWIIEHTQNFCNHKEGAAGERYALFGNLEMAHPANESPYDYADILPQKLKEIIETKLNKPGISSRIIRDWADSGRIILNKDKKNTILATIKSGNKQIRVIRLKLPISQKED